MTYIRPHRSGPSGRARLALAATAILVATAALIQWLSPSVFPGLFTAVARPFWRLDFSIESGAFRPEERLMAENESLKRALAERDVMFASSTLEALLRENEALRAELGRSSSTSPSGPRILAAVLSRPPLVSYDEIIIDLGDDRGISTSTLVYAPGGVLIGRVISVFGRTSRAALFSSPGQTFQVAIGPSNVPATAIGRGGGQYEADLPHGAGIRPGDVASDLSLSGAPFASVIAVDTDPSNPFDRILLAPPVNIYELRWVFLER